MLNGVLLPLHYRKWDSPLWLADFYPKKLSTTKVSPSLGTYTFQDPICSIWWQVHAQKQVTQKDLKQAANLFGSLSLPWRCSCVQSTWEFIEAHHKLYTLGLWLAVLQNISLWKTSHLAIWISFTWCHCLLLSPFLSILWFILSEKSIPINLL